MTSGMDVGDCQELEEGEKKRKAHKERQQKVPQPVGGSCQCTLFSSRSIRAAFSEVELKEIRSGPTE